MEKCSLCPRMCKVKREKELPSQGFCKMPDSPVLARAALHFWEEPCISGEKGSGTVFSPAALWDASFVRTAKSARAASVLP